MLVLCFWRFLRFWAQNTPNPTRFCTFAPFSGLERWHRAENSPFSTQKEKYISKLDLNIFCLFFARCTFSNQAAVVGCSAKLCSRMRVFSHTNSVHTKCHKAHNLEEESFVQQFTNMLLISWNIHSLQFGLKRSEKSCRIFLMTAGYQEYSFLMINTASSAVKPSNLNSGINFFTSACAISMRISFRFCSVSCATKQPRPTFVVISPLRSNSSQARFIVITLMPSCAAIVRIGGRHVPPGRLPQRICAAMPSKTYL